MAAVHASTTSRHRLRDLDPRWALAALVLASIVLRLAINTRFAAPTILTDELTYTQLARRFADGEIGLASGYGAVYPLLLAPSWLVADLGTTAFTLMKTTNAILMSLVAVPIFLWARRLMRPGFALLAAALVLALPMMAYSGHVMTENAFALALIVALWAIASAVERPTAGRQTLVVVAIGVAVMTRSQALVLVAALPMIVVLAALVGARTGDGPRATAFARALRPWWPTALVVLAGVVAVIARMALSDWSWRSLLQAYSATADGQYTAGASARYFLWHLGEASLALGVIPVAALGLLVGLWLRGRLSAAADRAFVATAVIAAPLVLLQVAIFTSYWSQRVSERNMMCVFPLFVVALCLWLDRGMPRPRWTSAIAAAIAGGVVLCVPFAFLYQRSPSTETWGLVLPSILARRLTGGADDVQILIVAGVAVALLAFGILRPRLALVGIPVLLVAYFAISQYAVVREVGRTAADYRAAVGTGDDATWIDQHADAAATLILGSPLGPDTDRLIAWQVAFFNRTPVEIRTWGADLVVDPATGSVSGAPLTPIVMTPASHQLIGDTLEARAGWLLQSPSTPLALSVRTSGVYPDGWTAPTAWIDIYAPPSSAGQIRISAGREFAGRTIPGTVAVRLGPIIVAEDGSTTIGTPQEAAASLTVTQSPSEAALTPPTTPYRIEIDATPPIIPTDFGVEDPRQLGTKANIYLGDDKLGY
jgi:hypothetical protein